VEQMKNIYQLARSGRFLLVAFCLFTRINLLHAQNLWVQTNMSYVGSIQCFAVSGTNLFAGTDGGGVFLSSDSSTSWTAVNAGLIDTIVTALAVSGTNLFAGTDGGGVFRSTNNGASWTTASTGLTNNTVWSLCVSGTILFAGTSSNGLFHSTDNGASWWTANTLGGSGTDVIALAVIGTNLFAGTRSEGLFLSTNNGASWTAKASWIHRSRGANLICSITALAVFGTNLFAAASEAGVFVSPDNGTTWVNPGTNLPDIINGGYNLTALAVFGTNLFVGEKNYGVWRSSVSEVIQFFYSSNLGAWYPLNSTPDDTIGMNGSMLLTNTPFHEGGIYCNGIDSGNTNYCQAITPALNDFDFNSFTISAKFKVSEYPNISENERPVFIGGDVSRWVGFILMPDSTVLFRYNNSFSEPSSVYYSLNSWHDATITYDGQTGKLYLDSVLACTAEFQIDGENNKNVGITDFANAKTFKGWFRDLKIYACMVTPPLVLPVELTAFTVSLTGFNAKLQWKTATEVNNYGFEVERRPVSSDRASVANWGKIGFVQGNGTSNAQHNYSFIDQNIAMGKYSYRLKQIDNDNTFKYSQESEVTIVVPNVFTMSQNFPNPFNPSTTISFSLPSESFVSMKVFDILGREVSTLVSEKMPAGSYTKQWNASNLGSGIYFYRLQAGSFTETKKLVLLK